MRVSQDVLAVLDRAVCEGNALSLTALGQLDRKLYVATNKALEAAGGNWSRRAQAHLFDGDAVEAIEPIILTGEIVSVRQQLQQIDTPTDLAGRVIREAQIEPGMFVLEPSAGLGALATPAADAGGVVECFEICPKRAFALSDSGRFNVTCYDFLRIPASPVNDRVVMNPPFAKGQDIAHVMHAYGFLKPGGRLVAIVSGSVQFRQGRFSEFRDWLMGRGGALAPLPSGSFKASNTNVSTCLVTIDLPCGAI